jgi:hypothetical protein
MGEKANATTPFDPADITPDMIRAGVNTLRLGLQEGEMEETIVTCILIDMLRAKRGDITPRQVRRE